MHLEIPKELRCKLLKAICLMLTKMTVNLIVHRFSSIFKCDLSVLFVCTDGEQSHLFPF